MSESDEIPAPALAVRWMRPLSASALLELPTAPVVLSTAKDWQALTAEESSECEIAWRKLSDEERKAAEEDESTEGVSRDSEDIDDEDEDIIGVSIARDKLFEVDVRRMRLRPIYWKMNSPPIKVIRGLWFYDDHHPVPRELAEQLEELYLSVKPYLPAYEIELTTAFEQGSEAHAKLKQPLDETQSVVFENSSKAYIVQNSSKRFFSFLPGTSSSKPSTLTFYPGSKPVYRGYEAAAEAGPVQTRARSASVPTKRKANTEESGYQSDSVAVPSQEDAREVKFATIKKPRRSVSRGRKPIRVGNEDGEDNVMDLVLIIHGIGQGLASQYEGYNFVYAANLFRQIARKQSTTPALASVMRDRRVQFLPVQWRTNFQLSADEESRREAAGIDNNFTLNDITIRNTVPYVRDLMNNVLIDIPYFLSQHKDRMIQAVAKQANRIYRLWCARNPGFDKNGRVHILAHSLGSALAGHILSNQPTIQPPLSEMEPSYARDLSHLFLFNTAPFPLFVHINRSQVIARKGRERTMNSPADEASVKEGLFGCLAVDSLYNIFNPSDPIAYLMNPTVDARKAKEIPPSIIKNVSVPMFSSFSTRVSRLWEGMVTPSPRSRSPSRPRMPAKASSGFELGGSVETVVGTKEERRFLALNPRGTLDFALPSEGNLSSYFDMITAHSAYWSDPNLAAFILAEIFARKEDLARTGLGVEAARENTRE
ncbi:uncharacterized protein FOMMEDRAFT_171452 [Fomitiporia mediterranea MF3/22]|uniref:uncharacterized protein n=1 Tax=Fomitiporia mediterranea (strain MF3/22) TaxID=694068 RepID=UPI0004407640|nr:uncharacterized protein FOMMEDRAFT_171452 [Fomitiporia mediterranea MF3/22]EJC98098.1 hypothetical protein FOMMEDRAFT_171452 [Fomitiporia mediterranea MF3/22]